MFRRLVTTVTVPKMADKQALTARMPPDTYSQVMDYRQARDLTKSDAARRLIESGLDAEQSPDSPPGMDLLIAGLSALLAAVVALAILAYGIVGAVVVAGSIVVGFAVAWVALGVDRTESKNSGWKLEQ